MRILILDDDQVRHDAFLKLYSEHSVYQAYNARDFKLHLRTIRFDIVSFDHDLGEGEPSGLDCARFMLAHLAPESLPTMCIVHSQNPVGAMALVQELTAAGISVHRKPFSVPR